MQIPLVAGVEGVGQNMQDHPDLYLTWGVKKGTSTNLWELLSPLTVATYLKQQTGEYMQVFIWNIRFFIYLNKRSLGRERNCYTSFLAIKPRYIILSVTSENVWIQKILLSPKHCRIGAIRMKKTLAET